MSKLDPDTYDKREVPCPACGAKAGSYCKRPSGHSGPFVGPHAARTDAAHEKWTREELDRFGEIVSPFLRKANGRGPSAQKNDAQPQQQPAKQQSLFDQP